MSNQEKYTGKILNYDVENDIVKLQFQFMTPEKQELLEHICNEKAPISFLITSLKPRFLKSHRQLREYFLNLKLILQSFKIDPISENVKTLDNHFKMNVFDVEYIELGDERIPHTKSKANMTVDEMNLLILTQRELYEERVDFDLKEVRQKYRD